MNKELEASRFWGKIKKVGDCWLWDGSQDNGYGKVSRNGKILYSHRYAYQLFKDEVPEDHDVRHTCNNSLCVNPEHLYLYKYSDEEKLKIFWSSFEKHENGCWIWKGPTRNINGYVYGYIYIGGMARSVRDLMWELTYGKVQGRHMIGSTCGNKLCVNPEHLFLRGRE